MNSRINENNDKLLNEIFEAVKLNNKESAINLTRELIKNQTDQNRIKSLEKLILSLS